MPMPMVPLGVPRGSPVEEITTIRSLGQDLLKSAMGIESTLKAMAQQQYDDKLKYI